jgi:hypothetical protein
MRSKLSPVDVCIFLLVGAGPCIAFQPPEINTAWPTQHQIELRYADGQTQPYAMNYTDEAAQKLGIHDGQWEAFETHPSDPLLPSFKGGVDKGSAMFKLQWTPGG